LLPVWTLHFVTADLLNWRLQKPSSQANSDVAQGELRETVVQRETASDYIYTHHHVIVVPVAFQRMYPLYILDILEQKLGGRGGYMNIRERKQ
jgi:hypothetical protein